MKKLFILIVMCIVGMVLPQRMLAAVTIDTSTSGKVIVRSEKAGDLATYLNSATAEQLAAFNVGEIDFVGKFNEDDLNKLKEKGCCTQSVVDMSEAKFIKKQAGQDQYYLYHSTNSLTVPDGVKTNDKCLVGGTYWKSEEVLKWVPTTETPPNNNYQDSYGWTVDNINTDHLNDHHENAFVRIANEASYYRLDYDNKWVEDEPNNYAPIVTELPETGSNEIQKVRIPLTYSYWKLVEGEYQRSWIEAEESDGTFTYETNSMDNALYARGNDNEYVYHNDDLVAFPSTYSYYKWETAMKWTPISESDVPSDATVTEPNWDENDRINHTNNSGTPPQYIRFVHSYVVYKKKKSGEFTWKEQNYEDGKKKKVDFHFASEAAMTAPTKGEQFAYVGGEEYQYNGSGWSTEITEIEEYDYNMMSFKNWGANVTKAITSKYVDPTKPLANNLCNGCSSLTDLTINSGTIHKIYDGDNNKPSSLEKVTIGNKVAQIGNGEANGGFAKISTITEVNFEEGGNVPLVFKNSCFIECTGLTEISIPARATLIEPSAFSSCENLGSVTFEKPSNQQVAPLVIQSMAFQNCAKIKEVIIEPKTNEKLLICEYNAFSFNAMEAQTQIDGEMATLYFPEDNFDFYAGEWKKGMAFSQAELNAFKDGLEIKDGEGNVIYANPDTQNPGAWHQQYGFAAIWHYDEDDIDGYYHDPNGSNTKYAPGNGWQQFAKTASKREIIITGNIYMTYSTDKPYSLPEGIIAFRVTDYVQAGTATNGKTKNGKLVLKMIDQVPTETGMLLISTNKYKVTAADVAQNPNIQTMFYFGDPKGTPDKYHYTEGKAGDATSNYLAPAVNGIQVGPVSDAPDPATGVVDINARPFTHRNFIMRKDTHQFVRTKKGTMAKNRAFLSLPKEMFTNDNESDIEGPNPWNTNAGDAFENYETTQYDDPTGNTTNGNAKTFMFFEYDVEKYGMIWPLAKMNDDLGITTAISTVQQENVSEGIYTLQGVKVSAPATKGIYIVNGKKVVFK